MSLALGVPTSLETNFGISLDIGALPGNDLASVVDDIMGGLPPNSDLLKSIYVSDARTLELDVPAGLAKVFDTREVGDFTISAADMADLGVEMAIVPTQGRGDWRKQADALAEHGISTGLALERNLDNRALTRIVQSMVAYSPDAPPRLVVAGDVSKDPVLADAPDIIFVRGAIDYVMMQNQNPRSGMKDPNPNIVRPDMYLESADALRFGVGKSRVRAILSIDPELADPANLGRLQDQIILMMLEAQVAYEDASEGQQPQVQPAGHMLAVDTLKRAPEPPVAADSRRIIAWNPTTYES